MVGRATNCCSYSDLLNKLSPILSDSKLKESWSAVEINLRSLDKARLRRQDLLLEVSKVEKEMNCLLKMASISLKGFESLIKEDKVKKDLSCLIKEKWKHFMNIKRCLPQTPSPLLKLVLGEINVTLPHLSDRFRYKSNYENFKLRMNIIGLLFSLLAIFIKLHRFAEALLQAAQMWFYLTLTIREHILIANGSNIRVWWLLHHYGTVATVGLLLTWPEGFYYRQFSYLFHIFSSYVAVVHVLQFQYQTKGLYRLRALGKADAMDITVEDVRLKDLKGALSLLLPFLLVAQLWQIFLGYELFQFFKEGCTDWQVPYLSFCSFFLGLGNIYATSATACSKFLRLRYLARAQSS
ncbi:ion channel TACAN-like [Zophobas morio]|uniref:ion channel TACAN-like n=1 Tax=Zophobas morio TaxID=2755281 RepID=UPI003082D53C